MNFAMFVSSVASDGLRQFFLLKRQNSRYAVLVAAAVIITACQPDPTLVATIETGPAVFSGSETCRNCHTDQFESWQDSHHALAMQVANDDTVVGDFSGVEFSYFDSTSTFFKRDDRFFVSTENAAGVAEEFLVSYAFGVYPLQQYLIELPRGHVQPLTIAWDDRPDDEGGQQWFDSD